MIYYISPSKTMKLDHLEALPQGPFFVAKKPSELLRAQLLKYSVKDLETLYKVSETVAENAYELLRIDKTGTAMELFEGLVYKNLDYKSLEMSQKVYIDETLLIGSALYGVVRANQRLRPYRLDLDNPVVLEGQPLTQFWVKKVTNALIKLDSDTIINLASEEYSALLDLTRLRKHKKVIRIEFRTINNGKLINGATHAKMARGKFVRQAAIEGISTVDALKDMKVMGYQFDDAYSKEHIFFFTKPTNGA